MSIKSMASISALALVVSSFTAIASTQILFTGIHQAPGGQLYFNLKDNKINPASYVGHFFKMKMHGTKQKTIVKIINAHCINHKKAQFTISGPNKKTYNVPVIFSNKHVCTNSRIIEI